jgi:hypothetical protein
MLKITIPSIELYDGIKNEFTNTKEQVLHLEHSLVSLSKWESKWCKPFLAKEEKTIEESIDYIRCMTTTQNVNPNIYKVISQKNILEINKYIDEPMTATTFSKENTPGKRGIITAEVIYYWMIALNIPFECQKWHLNRLLTLIKVCNIKNNPPKNMSKKEVMSRNAALNAARRKSLNSRG